MAGIGINGPGEREFRVRDRERETTHRVTVPERLLAEFGVAEDELERVEGSFRFLLEREPSHE